MEKIALLPADTYIVVNRTVFNDIQDRKILLMLYQPIIGGSAINLYFTLWSYLDRSELVSLEWSHHHLMSSLRLNIDNIIEVREKLEAVGLLKTYLKKGDINTYVYELYSPLSAYEFFNNPILNTGLYNNIGKLEYTKVTEYFTNPKIELDNYEEITSSFDEVFEVTDITPLEHFMMDVKRVKRNTLKFIANIDFNNIISLIPEEMLNVHGITKETKDLIYKLAFIYKYDDDNMREIIMNSIDEKRKIDKEALKRNCRNYYQMENGGKLPSLIYRSQPEYLRKEINDTSKRTKMINMFETTSPYDFLYNKNNCVRPSKSDLAIVEYLLVDLELNPGVVNVLIDYVLRINNNKLIQSFVSSIASQWKRSNINTVEEAMTLAETEYKNRQTITKQTKTKKELEKRPEWFDKELEVSQVSEEEMAEMAKLLSEFK